MFEINLARNKHKSYHAKIVEYMVFFIPVLKSLCLFSQPAESRNPKRKSKTGIYVAFVVLVTLLVLSFIVIAVLFTLLFLKEDETIKGLYGRNEQSYISRNQIVKKNKMKYMLRNNYKSICVS